MIDWSQCAVAESIPQAGLSIDEVMEQFPVTREQTDSLMAFVAKSLEKAPSYA
jgi:uncharacterized protein (DUF433 family)